MEMFAHTSQWLTEKPDLENFEQRRILLTFDDGPSEYTDGILDILDKENIQALFFVVGQRLQTDQSIQTLKRIMAEGHLIGNHSESHANLTELAPNQIQTELTSCHQRLTSLGIQPFLFRPPYGQCNQDVMAVANTLHYSPFFWNLDSLDWKLENWVNHTLTIAAQPHLVSEWNLPLHHLIIDLHDIHHTTLENLSELINGLRALPNTVFAAY